MANPLSLNLPQGPPLTPVYGAGSTGDGALDSAAGAGLVDEVAGRIMADLDLLQQLALQRGSFAANLMNPSEGFGSWVASNSSLADNSGRGPFDYFNAAAFAEDTSPDVHLMSSDGQVADVLVGSPKAFSLFYRPNDANPRRKVYLGYDDGAGHFMDVGFDLETMKSGDVFSSGEFEVLDAFAQDFGNGWARLCAAILPNASVGMGALLYFGLADDDGQKTYEGDGVSGGFVFGAQLEDCSNFPNPYKPMPAQLDQTPPDPGAPRALVLTPYQDLLRYAYDLAAFVVKERKRRFS